MSHSLIAVGCSTIQSSPGSATDGGRDCPSKGAPSRAFTCCLPLQASARCPGFPHLKQRFFFIALSFFTNGFPFHFFRRCTASISISRGYSPGVSFLGRNDNPQQQVQDTGSRFKYQRLSVKYQESFLGFQSTRPQIFYAFDITGK